MAVSKLNWYWTLTAIFLVIITVIAGIVVWSRYSPGQPIEISLPQSQALSGKIYLGGAIANPGLYPCTTQDSLEALLQAAGGAALNANLNELRLYIPEVGEGEKSQRVNINRAEVWLLKALPGIGQILAQRIVDYRQQNGPFRNTHELLNVAGIGITTYERIKHLVTVAD